jgi:excisionase family DNA binding protein
MGDQLLLTASDVAAALRIGVSTAYRLMLAGELPSVRIGRSVRVPRAALEEWVRRQPVRATDTAKVNHRPHHTRG